MAYAAVDGATFPREPLEILAHQNDPTISLWASFVLASGTAPDASAVQELSRGSSPSGEDQDHELAQLLVRANRLKGERDEQRRVLDEATVWLRAHDTEAARLWSGWIVRGNRIVRTAVSKAPSSVSP